MKSKLLIAGVVALSALSAPAFAADGTVTGAAGGAITGAIVGGPVGAAVGGVVGAIAGTAIDPPPAKVVTYVQAQPMPAQPVVVKGDVVVGTRLPQEVALVTVPEDPKYAYAVVNQHRVIVDPKTYVVVQVVQ
jgi:hypothetical protein